MHKITPFIICKLNSKQKRQYGRLLAQLHGSFTPAHAYGCGAQCFVGVQCASMGAVPLPSTESMKTELAALAAKKDTLLAEYRTARSQAQEYETIKKNVDALLSVPKEQEQQRRHELE